MKTSKNLSFMPLMAARKSLLSFLVAVAVLAAASSQAHSNLILNGSFEDPVVPVGGYTNFLAGSHAITGWTVVGVDSAVVSSTFMQSGITFNAQAGIQWLDLTGVTSNSPNSGVTQSVATTIGQGYELKFYVGSTTDATSSHFFFPTTVDLSIDGGTRTHYFNPTGPTNMLDWKLFTVDFTAAQSTTNLAFLNGAAANNFETALDNVQLSPTAAPEPGSVTLLGLGLASFGGMTWLRKRKATLFAARVRRAKVPADVS